MTRDTHPTRVYPSKRDFWIAGLLWASMLGIVFGVYSLWTEPASFWFRLGFSLLLLAVGALTLWVLYGTQYTLRGKDLLIRSGPMKYTIPIDEILTIAPTRNPLSSPAVSLDRLDIKTDGRIERIFISPADRRDFLRDLVSRSDRLESAGENRVRRVRA